MGSLIKKRRDGKHFVPVLPDNFLAEAKWHMSVDEHRDLENVYGEWRDLNRRRQEAEETLQFQDPKGEATGGWTAVIGGEEFEGPEEMNWHRAYDRVQEALEEQKEFEREHFYPMLEKVLAAMAAK